MIQRLGQLLMEQALGTKKPEQSDKELLYKLMLQEYGKNKSQGLLYPTLVLQLLLTEIMQEQQVPKAQEGF